MTKTGYNEAVGSVGTNPGMTSAMTNDNVTACTGDGDENKDKMEVEDLQDHPHQVGLRELFTATIVDDF